MKRILCIVALGLFLAPLALAEEKKEESPCPLALGAGIIDAKDENGKFWGVLIQQTIPGGGAERIGLKPDDVVVTINGESLAPEGSEEEPFDAFVRILTAVPCGETVLLEYVRDGETRQATLKVPEAK